MHFLTPNILLVPGLNRNSNRLKITALYVIKCFIPKINFIPNANITTKYKQMITCHSVSFSLYFFTRIVKVQKSIMFLQFTVKIFLFTL